MLTIFNLYYHISDGDPDNLILTHWGKIKALADWLLWRWHASIRDYSTGECEGVAEHSSSSTALAAATAALTRPLPPSLQQMTHVMAYHQAWMRAMGL